MPADSSQKQTQIQYSEKYYDDIYEYRSALVTQTPCRLAFCRIELSSESIPCMYGFL